VQNLIFLRRALYLGAATFGLAGCQAGSPTAIPDATRQTTAVLPPSPYRVVHRFGGPDGEQPQGGLIDVHGTLYGTTNYGGSHGYGTVYSVTPNGSEKVVYSFKSGSDGANPQAALLDVNGTLYGTTSQGGGSSGCLGYGCGTVFSVTASGKEKVLHAFASGSDGVTPESALIDVTGTLYGTTIGGGSFGHGAVYSMTASGAENVVYSFAGGSDGELPYGNLLDVNGTLYGTTAACGGSSCFGTVYSVTANGTEKVLHAFTGCDGGNPLSGLINVKGKLYGTTSAGGCASKAAYSSRGTVYSVTTRGAFKVLHDFTGPPDGATPSSSLVDMRGTLYGTTAQGGKKHLDGTIYSITTAGSEQALYRFGGGGGGAHPGGGLAAVNGTLYGTAGFGGSGCSGGGCGVVFAFTR
jgi:uncharacterized repeat protein (TIGR03803 family)